jgi:hypothetical protein
MGEKPLANSSKYYGVLLKLKSVEHLSCAGHSALYFHRSFVFLKSDSSTSSVQMTLFLVLRKLSLR